MNNSIETARKSYSKPLIQEVRLQVDEAVLATGCKTSIPGISLSIAQACNAIGNTCQTDIGS